MFSIKKLKSIFLLASVFFILFFAVSADSATVGEYVNFNVDSNFSANEESAILATLIKSADNLYFYIEKSWWDLQVQQKKDEILANLDGLSVEFDNKIYPNLTSVFGSEWKPGVDGDNKITILFHAMKEGIGGYFRSLDEYIKLQVPGSNEREMLYLPVSKIESSKLKNYLAHEFVHLITFNQKERLQNVREEIWLNEARAEYGLTILEYNSFYEGSNLQKRVKDFLEKPSDSLTEWQETKYDYSLINVFFYYLIDHYGINILIDSLKSKSVGINSLNEALLKNGYKESFDQIFTDWTITVVVNDCSLSLKYCYLNQNLQNLKISSTLNFLPLSGDSSLSVTNVTKNWSGNWQKIIGGNGDLKLKFESLSGLNFKVPYLIFNKDNKYSINFLKLDKKEEGQIDIENFGSKYNSLIIIPSLQTKTEGFNGFEFTYPYTFTVLITSPAPKENEALIQSLSAQIDLLKKQIAALQNQNQNQNSNSCLSLNHNLYFGVLNKNEVLCLQEFLKSQGLKIYPEGLITGNFFNLTESAVIRFQERYKDEILTPLGLAKGTGFVGDLTRRKINQLLSL